MAPENAIATKTINRFMPAPCPLSEHSDHRLADARAQWPRDGCLKPAPRACEIALGAAMKVIASVALTPEQRKLVEQAARGVTVSDAVCRTNDEVLSLAAGGCDVMLGFRVPDDLVRRAPALKWIQLLSA